MAGAIWRASKILSRLRALTTASRLLLVLPRNPRKLLLQIALNDFD
jgi:hypothetical protein